MDRKASFINCCFKHSFGEQTTEQNTEICYIYETEMTNCSIFVNEKFELQKKEEEGNGYQMQNASNRCLCISVNRKQTFKIGGKRALFSGYIVQRGIHIFVSFFNDLRPSEVKHIYD